MKRLSILATLLLLPFLLAGQSSSKFNGSLLWEVSGNGLERPSYILGTNHLVPVSFTNKIPGFETAVKNTDCVVGELLMTDKSDYQQVMTEKMMVPENFSYRDMLSDDEYSRLDEGLRSMFGAGMEAFGAMHPVSVAIMVSIFLYMDKIDDLDMNNMISIDEYMQVSASESGKKCFALETIQQQAAIMFDSQPIEKHVRDLVCMVDNIGLMHEIARGSMEDFYAGDIAGMYDLAHNNPDDPCPSSEEFNMALLKNRNDAWIKQLPGFMSDMPCLIVVGALHLSGEEGLLFQLDRLGYAVKAVN